MNKKDRKRLKKLRRTPKWAASPPLWDESLPREKDKIEEAMEHILQNHAAEIISPAPAIFLPDGSKRVPMSPPMVQLMKLQEQLFRATFNREPRDNDPVFWDHDREHEGPKPFNAKKRGKELQKGMLAAGIRPEMAYAAGKTGLIISQSNLHLFTDEQLDEWEDAVEEYKRNQHGN